MNAARDRFPLLNRINDNYGVLTENDIQESQAREGAFQSIDGVDIWIKLIFRLSSFLSWRTA